jgi:hypothetical protein
MIIRPRTTSRMHNPARYQTPKGSLMVYRTYGRAVQRPMLAELSRSQQTKEGVL